MTSGKSLRVFDLTPQKLLMCCSLGEFAPLYLCIKSQNKEGIFYLLDLYLSTLKLENIAQLFCTLDFWFLEGQQRHGNFFHFVGRHAPEFLLEIYERLENHLPELLPKSLLPLDYSGLRPLDFLKEAAHQEGLLKKMPKTPELRKVLVLDIDETLLVKRKNKCLETLIEKQHYVIDNSDTFALLQKDALKALILWTLHHPEMLLYVVTSSSRNSFDVCHILAIVTDKKIHFILERVNGIFTTLNENSEEFLSFLEKENLDAKEGKGFAPRKHVSIKYLLTHSGLDLNKVSVCLYDDRPDILKRASEEANYQLETIQADLLTGSQNSLHQLATFCEMDQPIAEHLPKDLLEPYKKLFNDSLEVTESNSPILNI